MSTEARAREPIKPAIRPVLLTIWFRFCVFTLKFNLLFLKEHVYPHSGDSSGEEKYAFSSFAFCLPCRHEMAPVVSTVKMKCATKCRVLIFDLMFSALRFVKRVLSSYECSYQFKCHSYYCVPWAYLCDGKSDCPLLDDEKDCSKWNCLHMFRCKQSLVCIHLNDMCNRKADCVHGEDELLCDLPSCPRSCSCFQYAMSCSLAGFPFWKCLDQTECVKMSIVCDEKLGYPACPDKSDESFEVCHTWNCSDDRWKCRDNKTCVLREKIMDGKINCQDKSDEILKYHEGRKCLKNAKRIGL